MNNPNQYQQPQQAPQQAPQAPQQPQYQPPQQPQCQPPYQPPQAPYQAPQAPKKPMNLNVFIDKIVALLPILAIVFLAFAVVGLLYYFITGIVNAVDLGFGMFMAGLASAFGAVAKYFFYAAVTACFAKILNKK